MKYINTLGLIIFCSSVIFGQCNKYSLDKLRHLSEPYVNQFVVEKFHGGANLVIRYLEETCYNNIYSNSSAIEVDLRFDGTIESSNKYHVRLTITLEKDKLKLVPTFFNNTAKKYLAFSSITDMAVNYLIDEIQIKYSDDKENTKDNYIKTHNANSNYCSNTYDYIDETLRGKQDYKCLKEFIINKFQRGERDHLIISHLVYRHKNSTEKKEILDLLIKNGYDLTRANYTNSISYVYTTGDYEMARMLMDLGVDHEGGMSPICSIVARPATFLGVYPNEMINEIKYLLDKGERIDDCTIQAINVKTRFNEIVNQQIFDDRIMRVRNFVTQL